MSRPLKFAGKLNILIARTGLTSAALSVKSKVPEKTLERYRAGTSAPGAAHLLRLLKAIDAPMPLNIWDPEDFELPEGM